jgi:hypothetical protein
MPEHDPRVSFGLIADHAKGRIDIENLFGVPGQVEVGATDTADAVPDQYLGRAGTGISISSSRKRPSLITIAFML